MVRLLIASLLSLVSVTIAGAADPTFVVTGTDGKNREGMLQGIAEDGSLSVGMEKVAGKAWVHLRREGQRLPAFPDGAQLILNNGDHLPLQLASLALTDEKITLKQPLFGDGQSVKIPLTAVVLLWIQPLDDGEEAARLRRKLMTGQRSRDMFFMRNGDLLEGIFTRLQDGEAEIEIGRKKVPMPLSKMSALVLSSDLSLPLRPRGAHARLILDDGTRLTISDVRSDGTELTGKTVFGATLKVPLQRVAALEARHDNVVYLSDLKAKTYQHTPFLGLKWALKNDSNASEGDLRLRSGIHDKGLGMHSASRVTYSVPPGWERFEAIVGLDERSGKLGSVQLRVEVDGTAHTLLDGKELTPASGGVPVKIAVKGARELTLIVDYGHGGDVGDVVNWVDARFVK